MGRYLRAPIDVERAVTADATLQIDLPVNPLSAIKITLDSLDSAAVTAQRATGLNILEHLTNVDVQFKGSSIITGSGQDLALISALLGNGWPDADRTVDAASGRSRVTLTIPFSRRVYWAKEAFPATRRGEFRLILTVDDIFGTQDLQNLHIEGIELHDATPTQWLKYTTISKTPTATGDHEVDLPIGNPILGALLFGTTFPTGAAATASIRRLKLKLDNVEQYFNDTRWASLHSDLLFRLQGFASGMSHVHEENRAAAYAANVQTNPANTGALGSVIDGVAQYAYLDFDPLTDDSYMLDTEGRGRVNLQINADVADAIRVLPIELIRIPGGG